MSDMARLKLSFEIRGGLEKLLLRGAVKWVAMDSPLGAMLMISGVSKKLKSVCLEW